MINEIVDRVSRRNCIIDAIARVKMENICQGSIVRERYILRKRKEQYKLTRISLVPFNLVHRRGIL